MLEEAENADGGAADVPTDPEEMADDPGLLLFDTNGFHADPDANDLPNDDGDENCLP